MKALKKPQPKKFSSRNYKQVISKLRKNTPVRVIGKRGTATIFYCELLMLLPKSAAEVIKNKEFWKSVNDQ